MNIRFPYGKSSIIADVPSENLIAVTGPKPLVPATDPDRTVSDSLDHPLLCDRIEEIVNPSSKVSVVISDITRPIPNKRIIPIIMRRLTDAGVPARRVKLVVAPGGHRRQDRSELNQMLGEEIVTKIQVVSHDCLTECEMIRLGETSFGTPVEINKTVADADVNILTGLIEPHNYAGFSGGSKSILPGVSSIKTISANHSPDKLDHPKAVAGILEGNPIHEDMEEAAKMAGVDFVVNIVTDNDWNIAKVFSGDLVEAHRTGTACCHDASRVTVSEPADIAIVGSGFPWDQNLYLAIKGPNRVVRSPNPVLRKGGVIIVAAECSEGIGHAHTPFYELMAQSPSIEDILAKTSDPSSNIKDKWEAHCWAKIMERHEVIVVTRGISIEDLKRAHMRGTRTMEEAISYSLNKLGSDSRIVPLPTAVQVIPVLENC